MIATSVEALAALAPADAHVLDLGGGTGALSWAVLDGLPGARVTVLDVDADMLAEARRRLAGFADRSRFSQQFSGSAAGGGRGCRFRHFPLAAELGALREAGFDEVERFWRRGLSAVTSACARADAPRTQGSICDTLPTRTRRSNGRGD
jgi:SAM-dependent methyltransferase